MMKFIIAAVIGLCVGALVPAHASLVIVDDKPAGFSLVKSTPGQDPAQTHHYQRDVPVVSLTHGMDRSMGQSVVAHVLDDDNMPATRTIGGALANLPANLPPAAVPVPAGFPLMFVGMAVLGLRRSRRAP